MDLKLSHICMAEVYPNMVKVTTSGFGKQGGEISRADRKKVRSSPDCVADGVPGTGRATFSPDNTGCAIYL